MTYSYDANNKLTQLVGPSGTTTFGYDANGNMTGMNLPDETVWAYGYDYENRLSSVTDNDSYTAAYTYAADGTRIRAQESNAANTDKWFHYDGMRPVLEGTLSSDTWTTRTKYVWEGDSYYDPLVLASIGGQDRFYLFDGLGSTRQLLDGDQAVTDSYSYEAFGNVLSDGGSTPNPYRYVGSLGYYATGSSLMHLGTRHYVPEVGRFISLDPSRQERNYYAYVGNCPTRRVDPSGLGGIPSPPIYEPPGDIKGPGMQMAWHLCMQCCMLGKPSWLPGFIMKWICTRVCREQLTSHTRDWSACKDSRNWPGDYTGCRGCCDRECANADGTIDRVCQKACQNYCERIGE